MPESCPAQRHYGLSDRLQAMVRADSWRMDALMTARRLQLPDWAIGAGFLRSLVWDVAHGFENPTPLGDIDLLFFDSEDTSLDREQRLEAELAQFQPGLPWEVRNQARMHKRKGNPPYENTADALRYWLETATCVAMRLEDDDGMTVIAPFGLEDLFTLRSRPTPAGLKEAASYRERMERKNWPGIWPKVVVETL